MAQIFSPRANTVGRVVLVSIAALPVVILGIHVLLMNSAYLTGRYRTLTQPIPFSHKHHVTEVGIDCRYCHYAVETSGTAGIPPTEVCMSCHAHLWIQAPMLAPVRASYATGEPIHWRQINRLPGYVYFEHSIHVAKGIGCTTCHGPIGDMPLTFQAQSLTMGWCLSCHRDPGPYVRPPGAVYDPGVPAKDERPERQKRLLTDYLISTQHLTDCSTCHR